MVSHIYILIDPLTEEIRYVGKTSGCLPARLRRHIYHLKSAGGRRNHKVCWLKRLHLVGLTPRIELVQTVPSEVWPDAERYWISFFRSLGCSLTNGTDGGEGGVGHHVSDELRAATSALHKGKVISDTHKAIVGEAAKARWAKWRAEGSHTSDVTRAKISKARKGKPMPEGYGATVSARRKGTHHTLETRNKMSLASKGRRKSDEHRSKTLKQYMKVGE